MMDGVKRAHSRADLALVGGISLMVLGMAPFAGVNLYSDRAEEGPVAGIVEPARIYSGSPVELASAQFANEMHCMAEVMYYEARSEGLAGQKAVAEVVLRRTHNKNYADTVCSVVHEGVQPGRKAGCQFSFACDGSLKKRREGAAWEEARLLAEKIMMGSIQLGNHTGSAISYHTVDVSPPWSETMLRTTQIGNHIFYRFMPRVQVAQAGTKLMAASQMPPS
jgi:spore germination cell wall hydrolase CwlJ-like protein